MNKQIQSIIETVEKLPEGEGLEMEAGCGESDYPCELIFTTSRFVISAFGLDRDNCEDLLQCILRGRYTNNPDFAERVGEGDREFVTTNARPSDERLLEAEAIADWVLSRYGVFSGTQAFTMAEMYRSKYPKTEHRG